MSKMMGVAILTAALFFQSTLDQAANENLKKLANECGKAIVTEDFNRVVDLTYPKVVELMGGRAKMIALLHDGMQQMKAQGQQILSSLADDPIQVTTINKQIFAVVPTTLKIKVPQGVLVSKSITIGVSSDNGKSWTFVSGDNLDEEKMKIVFPSAAGKLKIPPHQEPTLIPGN